MHKYKKDYEAQFKTDVSAFGGHASDALMLVVDALKSRGWRQGKNSRLYRKPEELYRRLRHFQFQPRGSRRPGQKSFEMLTVKDGNIIVAK